MSPDEIEQLLAAIFPIASATAALARVPGPLAFAETTPVVRLELVIRDSRTSPQEVFLPDVGTKTAKVYERELKKCARAAARELEKIDRSSDAHLAGLMPHDIWYPP